MIINPDGLSLINVMAAEKREEDQKPSKRRSRMCKGPGEGPGVWEACGGGWMEERRQGVRKEKGWGQIMQGLWLIGDLECCFE